MSPVLVNGHLLGVKDNGIFTNANTDPIPGGKLWVEAARSWNDMYAAAITDGIQPWEFRPAGPNSSARGRRFQDYVWDLYLHGGNPAARPYTSNHGWAIAVDVATKCAVAWMMKHAAKFGWSHDEGAQVGEWWHWRYIGGYKPRKKLGTYAYLNRDERRWCSEYDRLRRSRTRVDRRRELKRAMTRQRKAIWKAAQTGGWDQNHRRARYRALLARTK